MNRLCDCFAHYFQGFMNKLFAINSYLITDRTCDLLLKFLYTKQQYHQTWLWECACCTDLSYAPSHFVHRDTILLDASPTPWSSCDGSYLPRFGWTYCIKLELSLGLLSSTLQQRGERIAPRFVYLYQAPDPVAYFVHRRKSFSALGVQHHPMQE